MESRLKIAPASVELHIRVVVMVRTLRRTIEKSSADSRLEK